MIQFCTKVAHLLKGFNLSTKNRKVTGKYRFRFSLSQPSRDNTHMPLMRCAKCVYGTITNSPFLCSFFEVERRRRFNINDRIKELGTLIPKSNDP